MIYTIVYLKAPRSVEHKIHVFAEWLHTKWPLDRTYAIEVWPQIDGLAVTERTTRFALVFAEHKGAAYTNVGLLCKLLEIIAHEYRHLWQKDKNRERTESGVCQWARARVREAVHEGVV